MGKPYSMDLRERAVAAVVKGGMSCHQALLVAGRFQLHGLANVGKFSLDNIFNSQLIFPLGYRSICERRC
jgi:transposase